MIKLIIFDQDGTLYERDNELMLYTRNLTKEWIRKSLNISRDEVEKIYKELPKNYPNPYDGFKSLGLTIEGYMTEVFDKINPQDFIDYNNDLYNFFKNSNHKKALVTFSSSKYTKQLQGKLNIYDFYDKIIYASDLDSTSKGEAYKKLIDYYRLDPNEVCVVGDDFANDIKPAQEIGCKSIWVTKECNRENEVYIKNIKDLSKINFEEI